MLPPPSLAHVMPDRERERKKEGGRETDGQTDGETDGKYLRAVEVETEGFLGFIGLCMLTHKHPCTCVYTHTHILTVTKKVWQHISVIPALGKLRQEDGWEFEDTLTLYLRAK